MGEKEGRYPGHAQGQMQPLVLEGTGGGHGKQVTACGGRMGWGCTGVQAWLSLAQ